MKRKILFLFSLIVVLVATHVDAQVILVIEQPSNLAGSYSFGTPSGWGGNQTFVQGASFEILRDASTTADSCGCGPAVSNVAGKFAVVYRGGNPACEFGTKALNAQNAGAVGVLIVNHSSGVVGMLAGADGASVTIPVLLLSKEDGELFRPAIDNGTLIGSMGDKTGAYSNDIGFYKQDIVMANAQAIPHHIATNLEIPVGAWVHNYGYDNQTNITLAATITKATNSLYYETTVTPINIAAGDSAFMALPVYTSANPDSGVYTLTYTVISAGATDDYITDNNITTTFFINTSIYSKVRIDPTTYKQMRTGGVRTAAASGPDFTWCITLNPENANGRYIEGLSFSASTTAPLVLDNIAIEAIMYEWNDPIPTTGAMTFNDIVPVANGSAFYDYETNLQDSVVTAKFENPILIEDAHLRYLGCVIVRGNDIFIGLDDKVDYTTNWENYDDAFFPVHNGASWNAGGFGTDYVPGIALIFNQDMVNVKESVVEKDSKPFPNPANHFITIPLKGDYTGMVKLNVYDVTGKIVKSEVVNMTNTNSLKVNTSDIENGTYFFQLTNGDKKATTFPVVISK
ncbi:MAG: T9SS type A sorting domain-containing protein [Bacteroidota bacterium]|nr:T9SS type A sorting domain-containing protein [Bacteroidota bacterium]